MTLLEPKAEDLVHELERDVVPAEPVPGPAPSPAPSAAPVTAVASPRPRVGLVLAGWLAVLIVGLGLVTYGLGPLLQQRHQRHLMAEFRDATERAANEVSGLPGATVVRTAPERGSPVGVIEIGSIRLQQVVVEGVQSGQTQLGPGHVPGTAGLGQPGNAVVVGRRGAFRGPFQHLRDVQVGERLAVVTTQGDSVYEVTSTRVVRLVQPSEGTATDDVEIYEDVDEELDGGTTAAGGGGIPSVDVTEVYGPSPVSQLTLITSASRKPWNEDVALVVVAELRSQPFVPTVQGGRSASELGLDGETGARAAAVLVVALLGLVLGGALVLYRRFRFRTAHLLVTGPVIAAAIVAGETFSRLLPAWM